MGSMRSTLWAGAALLSLAAGPTFAHEAGSCEDDARDGQALREQAARRVEWRARGANPASWLSVKLLGFNDFHGQISTGKLVANRPVGGAAVMASYLKAAQQGMEDRTFIVHAGDHVGASPPASALLQDEPSIDFLNLLGNDFCRQWLRVDPRCNLVGTLGNHEFDEGRQELMRLIYGGAHPSGPFFDSPYFGASFPYVSANVVDAVTKRPILPPYVIKLVRGVPIAFIGAVLKGTPAIVTASGVAGLEFQDEAEAINRYIPILRALHVRAIVVLIHEGSRQTSYDGSTQPGAQGPDGNIADIVKRLNDEVDVVVSGHAHSFTNALMKTTSGKDILVTQAFSASTAYADIDLKLDPATKDIVAKSAVIQTTWADAGPGLTPDPTVARLVARAEEKVAPLVNQVLGTAAVEISSTTNLAGESAMGNLIADAQRAAMGTDFAFMNAGGVRAGLDAGPATWGELFTIQPFGNSLVKLQLTGAQLYTLLEQQWLNQPYARILHVSGLTYTYDFAQPVGQRILEIRKDGQPIDRAATYSVTANNFIADGGDGFVVFKEATNRVGGPVDLDALIQYVLQLPQPFSAAVEGRITRLN